MTPSWWRRGTRTRGVAVATGGIVLGSAPGMFLPFIITATRGADTETDVYFLAVSAANLAATILTVVMERTVIPFAAQAQRQGRRAYVGLLCRLMALCAIIAGLTYAVAAVVLVHAVVPSAVGGGYAIQLAGHVAWALAGFPVISGASAVLAAGLFAGGRYAVGTWSLGLRSIVSAVLGWALVDSVGVLAFAAGLTLGEGLRLVLLIQQVSVQCRHLRDGSERSAPLANFVRVAWIHVVAMGVVSVNPLIDRAFAAGVAPGSATLLELLDKLYYAPAVLLGSGLAIVIGSQWASSASSGASNALRADFARSQRLTAIAAVLASAAAACCVWVAEDRIRRVSGLPSELPLSSTFALLVAGLPFALSAELSVRLLIAFGRTGVFLISATALLVVNVIGDWVGVTLFGLAGIAMASSAVRLVNALVLGFAAWKLLRAGGPADAP